MVNGAFMVKRALSSSKRTRKNPELIDVGSDSESRRRRYARASCFVSTGSPECVFQVSLNCFYWPIFLIVEKSG